jgi:DNA-directed RNA polymerase subunit F
MILQKRPITLAEVKEKAINLDEKPELKEYLKKFTKVSKDKGDKLIEELRVLNNVKLREESLIKIVDLLPKTSEDLNKVCVDVNLSEEETNAILEITKKY